MKEFYYDKSITIAKLRNSGKYEQKLLDQLEKNNLETLYDLSIDDRSEILFMEPLLLAVSNNRIENRYEVFLYYTDSLKREVSKEDKLGILEEIIKHQPELIAKTCLCSDEDFIIQYAENNPKIIEYMSSELKNNTELIDQLVNIGNQEITKEIIKTCEMTTLISENPELKDDKKFMEIAIKENFKNIECASDELKNDHTFIKDVCTENKETINYISEHTESFGKEGLTAAKEVLVEDTLSKAILDMQKELEEVTNKIKGQEEQNLQDPEELKQTAIRKRQLNSSINFLQRIKEGKVNQEKAVRLINGLCKNLDEDYRKELIKYIKMDDAIIKKENEKNQEHKQEDGNNAQISKDDIVKLTDKVKLPEVNKETIITTETAKTSNIPKVTTYGRE